MHRMMRIGAMAVIIGGAALLATGPAGAGKSAKLDIAGVTEKADGTLEIDVAQWRTEQDGDSLKLFGKKKDAPTEVGIACTCDDRAASCTLTRPTPSTARCYGSTCCAWVEISGEALDDPKKVQ